MTVWKKIPPPTQTICVDGDWYGWTPNLLDVGKPRALISRTHFTVFWYPDNDYAKRIIIGKLVKSQRVHGWILLPRAGSRSRGGKPAKTRDAAIRRLVDLARAEAIDGLASPEFIPVPQAPSHQEKAA